MQIWLHFDYPFQVFREVYSLGLSIAIGHLVAGARGMSSAKIYIFISYLNAQSLMNDFL